MVPLLLGVSVLTFALVHLAGNPVEQQSAMSMRRSAATDEALRRLYGLDKPLPVQYWNWLTQLCRLDLGTSLRDQRPVLDKIGEALPATLLLNSLALGVVLLVGIPFGVHSATHPKTRFTRAFSALSFIAYSFPEFWLALLVQLAFAVALGWLPISGYLSPGMESAGGWARAQDVLWHLAAPLLVSSVGAWAVLSRYVRNSLFEVLGQDYIRTARSKGLSERAVFWRHALPNALLPVINVLGLSLPGLIGGSVIIESIFAWPGMGRLAWDAALGYDYPVVMGVGIIAALLTVLGSLAADLAMAALDPRIKVG
jgi:peptide/nickel transport system permease protein